MRLLLLAPFLPRPDAPHGGGAYLGALCEALVRRAELGLVALVRPEEQARLDDGLTAFRRYWTLPWHERPTGRGRRRHQARMLLRWGLHSLPLVAAKSLDPGLPALVRRALHEFAPDAVLVELAQMAQYLPHLQQVPTVLTDHEAGVPANCRTDLGSWADRRDRWLWQRYVRRFYPLATAMQAVTGEDAAVLQELLGRPVAVRPPVVPIPTAPVSLAEAGPNALFLGDYSHHPNPEAAGRLARDVLPRLRTTEPRAELWLAGPHTDRLQHLAAIPGVRIVGFVADLPSLFAQVRVLLAPLWSGGGFRVKGLTALAHGLPVVTNRLGARGCAAPAPARQLGETDQELAALTLELLRSPERAIAAGQCAFAFAREHLGADAVAAAQLRRIEALLATHRRVEPEGRPVPRPGPGS